MSSLLEEYHPADQQAGPSKPTSPIPSFQLRRDINGTSTELLIQTFDDRILVVITQNGKIGCLSQASIPAVTSLPHPPARSPTGLTLPPAPDAISLTPLLGTPPDQILYSLYTSQIATLVWWTLQELQAPRRPVVVGLALNRKGKEGGDAEEEVLGEDEKERFMAVMGMVVEWPGTVQ